MTEKMKTLRRDFRSSVAIIRNPSLDAYEALFTEFVKNMILLAAWVDQVRNKPQVDAARGVPGSGSFIAIRAMPSMGFSSSTVISCVFRFVVPVEHFADPSVRSVRDQQVSPVIHGKADRIE